MSVTEDTAGILFSYLRDVIYAPTDAVLDIEKLPESFRDFGMGLNYFAECVTEVGVFADALAKGDLNGKMPSPGNEIAAPLKSLHASIKHLTWQARQVARGDYQQRVKFMGEFAEAFNTMTHQLEERRKIEIEEKSKLQRYINLILSNTQDIYFVFDNEGKAVLANEAYLNRVKPGDADEVRGKTFAELFSPVATEDFIRSMVRMIDAAHAEGRTIQTEQYIDFGLNGNTRAWLIHVTPMLFGNDTVMGTMVIFHDTTEIIEARHQAERAREAAEQSDRAKSDFLARMSHEMRTPMNAIIGMSSIGKAASDAGKKDASFKKIEDASSHLLGVINDILDMSKIEAEKFDLQYREFSFGDMIERLKSIIICRAAEKNLEFSVDVADGVPPFIVCDEQRLAQVITNLLSNAVKFTPEFGRVALSVKKPAEDDGLCSLLITVTDTGIGISKEQQKNLFTPFEQADGSISRKFGGTGLGLAISKRIVDMMGGRIRIESEPGKGSAFGFEIKVRRGALPAGKANTEPLSESGIFAGKRIIIAEDIEINREIISALLEDSAVEISFAFNGAEAVEMFASAPEAFGLILMDIQMPGTDGYEATKLIRSSGLPRAADIPIIAMSANVFREDVERCLSAGMNGHLGKPIDINEVTAKLKEYLLF